MKIVSLVSGAIILLISVLLISCGVGKSATSSLEKEQITVNIGGEGQSITINLSKGESHNHPTFALWVEDMDENFVQTIFVTKSIATGIFGHGPLEAEKWDTKPGWQKRPAALPYWIHKRNTEGNGPLLPDPEHPVVDSYSGATPIQNAVIKTKLDEPLKGKFRILMEVNQPWDWNEYWTNKLYDDADYRTSCQPSLIYAVTVDPSDNIDYFYLNPIGHGHYSGNDGNLYTDLSTITTAKEIFSSIKITFKN